MLLEHFIIIKNIYLYNKAFGFAEGVSEAVIIRTLTGFFDSNASTSKAW